MLAYPYLEGRKHGPERIDHLEHPLLQSKSYS